MHSQQRQRAAVVACLCPWALTLFGKRWTYRRIVLRGSNEYPYRSWGMPSSHPVGTTLLAYSGQGNVSATPFITLHTNSGIRGFSVYYPAQNISRVPEPFPPCVRGDGDNVAVRDMLLVNPYWAVDFATKPCGRHMIEALYGQPLWLGISVDQCYDIGRIRTIHFWPFWAPLHSVAETWQHSNAVGLDLQRTDWEVVSDVFSFGYHIGLRLRSSPSGACNGQFTDLNFDDVDVGIDAIATQPYACIVSNLNVANAGDGRVRLGVRARSIGGSSATLTIRGASFWGQLVAAAVWDNPGMLRIADSTVHAWNRSHPAVSILRGRAMLMGNAFADAHGVAVSVGASADRVIASSNELAGNTIVVHNNLTLQTGNHA